MNPYFVTVLAGFGIALVTGLILDRKRAARLPGGALGFAVAQYLGNNDLNPLLLLALAAFGHLSYVAMCYAFEQSEAS